MVALAFIVSTLVLFAVIAILLRPSADEMAMAVRLESLGTDGDGEAKPVLDLDLYLKSVKRGSFIWLEDAVSGTLVSRHIQRLIVQSDSTTAVSNVLMQSFAGVAALVILVWLFAPTLMFAVPAGLLGGYLPVAMLRFKCTRRMDAFNRALPGSIDMMARSLRAGHSLVAAIAIVAEEAQEPARMEFGEVYKKQNYGLPFRDALMQLLERVPSPDLRVLVTGILVQKDTGGNLVEILDRILFVIKERLRIQGEIRIQTAQGRLTGWILCALPIIMMILINMTNPGYCNVLFTDPLGKKMLYSGIGLLTVGGLIIRSIINGIDV
jgi:tight adherence protein B